MNECYVTMFMFGLMKSVRTLWTLMFLITASSSYHRNLESKCSGVCSEYCAYNVSTYEMDICVDITEKEIMARSCSRWQPPQRHRILRSRPHILSKIISRLKCIGLILNQLNIYIYIHIRLFSHNIICRPCSYYCYNKICI